MNLDLSTIHSAKLWDALFVFHRENHSIDRLIRDLERFSRQDPIALIRQVVCRFEMGMLKFEEFVRYLKGIPHHLAEAYMLQYGGSHVDLDYHVQVVDQYVNAVPRGKKPHQLLYPRPIIGSINTEACIRFYFGIGASLIFVGRNEEGKKMFHAAMDFAVPTGMTQLALSSEVNIAISKMAAGEYEEAAELFATVVRKLGSLDNLEQVEDLCLSDGMWSSILAGHEPVPSFVDKNKPLGQLCLQFSRAVLNQTFTYLPGFVSDLNRLLAIFTEGRKMSFAARLLDRDTVRKQADRVLEMEAPRRVNSMAYIISVFVRCHALVHLGMYEEALSEARIKMNSTILSKGELARIAKGIIHIHIQLFAGDRLTIPEIADGVKAIESYCLRQPPRVRRAMLEFGCRGMPNVALFLHHLGMSAPERVPEILEYLDNECLWVSPERTKDEGARYKGKRLTGYPLQMGETYTQFFDPDYDTTPDRIMMRKSRHQKFFELQGFKTPPPVVYDAMVWPVLDHLRATGVLDLPFTEGVQLEA